MSFIFKIKLEGSSKPPIWRKVKVNESITFDDFHIVIQIVFGWNNSHMYHFSPKGFGSTPNIHYYYDDSDIDDYNTPSSIETFPFGKNYDAEKIKLKDYFTSIKQKMVYIYDFGDNWKHTIELTHITDLKTVHPICLGGKGQAPIDDCGGIWGYYNMVEAINDNKHPEHEQFMEWLELEKGETWDLHTFDLKEVNDFLTKSWKVYSESKT